MTTSEALKKAQKKYQLSAKGKSVRKKALKKYFKTLKGKTALKKVRASDKFKTRMNTYFKSEKGKSVLKKSQKKYAQSTKGKLNAKKGNKKYQQAEKGKKILLKNQLAYYHRRIKKDPEFKLARDMRNRLRSFLRTKGINKNNTTMELVGCSKKFLKEHLEKQFKPGMNWSNHSLRGWHIDHIRPLSKFDCSDPKELKKACHYSNLQPLWADENLKKKDKY